MVQMCAWGRTHQASRNIPAAETVGTKPCVKCAQQEGTGKKPTEWGGEKEGRGC